MAGISSDHDYTPLRFFYFYKYFIINALHMQFTVILSQI